MFKNLFKKRKKRVVPEYGVKTIVPGYQYTMPKFSVGVGEINQTRKISRITFIKGGDNGQDGFLGEQLLVIAKKHFEGVNIGHLKDSRTTDAINHIHLALVALDERKEDRKARGVLTTNNA